LPNELATFGSVIVEGLVRPLARDQNPASGDTQVFKLMGFALAPSGSGRGPGAFGLNSVQQPYRTPGRARGDLQFGVQPLGVVALSIRGVLV
jgi:hypothetical protein